MLKNYKQKVFNQLLDDILYLRLTPGQTLDEAKLAVAHGVSRTPVREALLELKTYGLVKIIPRNGTYVSEIDYGSVLKALRVKARLEGLVAELATPNFLQSDIDTLEKSLAVQIDPSNPDYGKIMLEIDMAFHEVIHDKCFNEILREILERLQYQCFRTWYYLMPKQPQYVIMIDSLKETLEAFKSRDPIAARCSAEKHANVLYEMVQAVMN